MNRQPSPVKSEKGDRSNLPERPEGCFAQIGPVPFFAFFFAFQASPVNPEDTR